MEKYQLKIPASLDEAEWLAPRMAPFASCVAAFVPDGFAAYARVSHGADRQYANKSAPAIGNLMPDLLHPLCAALAEYTRTPHSCYFCLWDGYGWFDDKGTGTITFWSKDATPEEKAEPPERMVVSPAILTAAGSPHRVSLPDRTYLLLEGPLDAAAEVGWSFPNGHFVPQSPNLFWPADHAWCVATEIDLPHTYLAGPEALIESLLAHPRLVATRVSPGDPY